MGENVLNTVYFNANNPGSFGGVQSLARHVPTSINKSKNWLLTQDAYTLHKPIRRIFPRRKTFAKGINDVF
jgi:hypothetical protein